MKKGIAQSLWKVGRWSKHWSSFPSSFFEEVAGRRESSNRGHFQFHWNWPWLPKYENSPSAASDSPPDQRWRPFEAGFLIVLSFLWLGSNTNTPTHTHTHTLDWTNTPLDGLTGTKWAVWTLMKTLWGLHFRSKTGLAVALQLHLWDQNKVSELRCPVTSSVRSSLFGRTSKLVGSVDTL